MTAQENNMQQMLVTLRTRLLVMSAMVGLALDDACKALSEEDVARANAVIDGDKAINMLENEIDAKALSLLARTQPVACDLRFVVSALRMVVDLERIADEAASLAERTIVMKDFDMSFIMDDIMELMEVTRTTYAMAVDAFREGSPEKALHVRQHEDDAALWEVRIMHKLSQGQHINLNSEFAIYTTLIIRSLNRVWRRAMNIAEHTYFTYAGVNLKHHYV